MRKRPEERSRTSSNQERRVFSYYGGNRPTIQDTGPKPNKDKNALRKVLIKLRTWSAARWLLAFGILALVMVLVWVDVNPIIRVDDGQRPAREISQYRDTAREIISASPLNRTKIGFDYVDVEKKIAEKFPEIASISISFDLAGRKPVIRLSFHPPTMRVDTNGEVWVVDNRGVALAKEQDEIITSAIASLPLVKDTIGIGGEQGKSLLSSSDVLFIGTIVEVAKLKQMGDLTLVLPLVPKELDVQIVGEGYRTKFNLDEDPREQAGIWLAARETLASRGETPGEYLDVRAGEKVFWK